MVYDKDQIEWLPMDGPIPPPDTGLLPPGWEEKFRANLQAQLEAGGVLCGENDNGDFVVITKDGERILSGPEEFLDGGV